MGLGYSALMFAIVNSDLLSRALTADQIIQRIPLTFLVSFGVGFLIMILGAMFRQFGRSGRSGAINGDSH
jgi:hypothetical protein